MNNRTQYISNTIAFRASADLIKKLDADCERFDLSRGELVRAIVRLHYDTQPAALRDDVDRLVKKVALVHRNQARLLVSLLVFLGSISLEDAKQIARTNLLGS